MTYHKVIKNFISKETCDIIIDGLKDKYIDHPKDQYHPFGKSIFHVYLNGERATQLDKNKELKTDSIIYDLINLLQFSISSQFNLSKNDIKIKDMTYVMLEKDQGIPKHNDFAVSKNVVYSAILYLNDNYEGGEIVFFDEPWTNDETSTTLIPETGMLVFFEGDGKAVHEVRPVTLGKRHNFTIFFEGNVEK